MGDPVCGYDDPFSYDADVYWDGSCGPQPSPIEVPLIRLGGRPKPKKKVYCRLEVDTYQCYVNGVLTPVTANPIRYELEEDETDQQDMMVEKVKLRRGWSDLEFVVEHNILVQPNSVVEAEPVSIITDINTTEFRVDEVLIGKTKR